MEMEIHPRRWF